MFIKYTVLLLCSIQYGASIRCYECNSVNNSMCLAPDQYDSDTLMKFMPVVSCGQGVLSPGPNEFFCRKIVQTIFHKGYESDVRVTRSCGWVPHHRDCYKADNEDHLETVCQCFTDGCNAGPRLEYAMAVVMTLAALGLTVI